jgi:hypothetical protein
MYLTEEEARQKACCKTMPNHPDGKTAACLASVCLAWRWKKGMVFVDKKRREHDLGYCGFAGRPE